MLAMEFEALVAGLIPCRAADVVAGDSANVSRSRRMADDCFSAELNKEFYRSRILAYCDSLKDPPYNSKDLPSCQRAKQQITRPRNPRCARKGNDVSDSGSGSVALESK